MGSMTVTRRSTPAPIMTIAIKVMAGVDYADRVDRAEDGIRLDLAVGNSVL